MQVFGALLLAWAMLCPGAEPQPAAAPPTRQNLFAESAANPVPDEGAFLTPDSPPSTPSETPRQTQRWPEVWGLLGARGFVVGERMAPNGHAYDPLFALDLDLNIGLLPEQRLYLFTTSSFWTQRAGPQVTNPSQGAFDFSKREWDLTAGVAWNVAGPAELRAFGYALNNLNRGVSVTQPTGYADGVGLEGRWYLPAPDRYDVAKRPFLAVGYLPSKVLIDANGNEFAPGLFARAYLTCDLPAVRSYVFVDGQGITDDDLSMRLLFVDGGLASRPFLSLPALEFRVGATDTYDVRVQHNNRLLGYGAIRILF
jgi:hypothetical protein